MPGGGLSPTMDVVVSEEAINFITKALTALSIKYDNSMLLSLEQDRDKEKELLEGYINDNKSEGISAQQNNEIDTVEMLTIQFEPQLIGAEQKDKSDDNIFHDDKLADLSDSYYKTDRELKFGNTLDVLAQPDNITDASKMIAPELKIDEKTVSQFIDEQKLQHKPESEIISRIEQSIKSLFDQLLTSTQYDTNADPQNNN